MRRSALASLALLFTGISHADVVDDALGGRIGAGTTGEAIRALEASLDREPDDGRTLFALGVMQALHGWERVSQGLHRFGAGDPVRRGSAMVLPALAAIPTNPEPEPVTLDDLERMFLEGMEHLDAAERTLSRIGPEAFELRVDVLAIRMDFNGDGKATDAESFGAVLGRTRMRLRGADGPITELFVDFDRGDAEWLRGYCHLSLALDEWILAHDWTGVFDRAGHVFFPRNETPYAFLRGERSPFREERGMMGVDPIDLIAAIHMMRLPVTEPQRMGAAREHLLEAITCSRTMWDHYNAESDNGNEWIPNVDQHASLPTVTVGQREQDAWLAFLDDAEAMLQGELLLPFWRGDGSRGVNVRRIFEEPREFDLILWIQGSAAAPYLEEGEVGSREVWDEMENAFERHSFRHMFWFN